ncbi:hypothetical protein G1L22_13235 [Tenacibaculum finnmarkense]|uniref:hypothetical protein n=1 Tax=Tenacibaculum finnmarkense TaxID=2781243 RepID=UPI001EFAB1CF|nr:hypothetical protein [Tenacibaculum finnmarkense]MCG8740060.1 hypothetical protein [Tenacibaculum finnmarkense]MCG8781678.1 hypothetical protein [Tenacibaculum finnmarkense]MCG8791503.1 hypothetical protein [Tenacibaculum finnmarkense]MCG8801579.1 hypothetical protein [Tenacibaculum finnmarkense]MCG8914005.1 hypothetical protein [Tenacibaculum finnmarkense]
MAIIERVRTIHPDGRVTVKETIDNNKITVNKKDKLNGLSEFVFIFQKTVFEIIKSGELGKNEYRILLYLMAKTEFEKEINTTPYRISKELKMQQSPVGVAIRNLSKLNILIRDKELKTFRLNYEIGFKGSPRNYKKLQFQDKPLEIKPSNQTTILDKNQQNQF